MFWLKCAYLQKGLYDDFRGASLLIYNFRQVTSERRTCELAFFFLSYDFISFVYKLFFFYCKRFYLHCACSICIFFLNHSCIVSY